MPSITDTVGYLDSACAKPIRIDYSFPNSTSCVSANVSSTCVPGPVVLGGKQQWFSNQACTSDPTTFGNSFFGASTPQVLALVSSQNCSSPPTSGTHYPFASCVPTLGQVSTSDYLYNSFRVTEDVSTGALYWAAFSDVACTSFAGFELYGSVSSTNCVGSGTSVSLLNNQGLVIQTVYTGSDCLYPAALSFIPGIEKCTPSECNQRDGYLGFDTQYVSTQCTQEYNLPAASAKFFQGKTYAEFSHFSDIRCEVADMLYSLELNQCFLSSNFVPGNKSGNLTYVNGSLTALLYAAPGCQGTPAITQLYAIDGSCTNQAKVRLHMAVLPDVAGASSSSNVGAIVGGSVAGLVVILGVAGLVLFCQKRRASESPKSAVPASLPDVETSIATVKPEPNVVPPFITCDGPAGDKGMLFDAMSSVAQFAVPRKMELSALPQDWSVEE
ncbi:hypothetical protein HDU98_001511, partial [Podochytrium sp. JEL0797]